MFPLLTVTWQSYDSTVDLPGFNLNDLGSGNKTAPNWPAYVADYTAEWHPHLEAIRRAIITNKVWAGGDWHQCSAHGVPVLSDGHFRAALGGVGVGCWRPFGITNWGSSARTWTFTWTGACLSGPPLGRRISLAPLVTQP
jgi:hypothetical protein